MIFCSWVIVLSPFPVPEGRVAVPVRGENRARPRHPLRKPTTIVRLSSSYRTIAQPGPARLRRVHPPERITQEVKLPARNPTDPCLLLIHCQLQLAHDLAQMMQCVLRAAPSAQDHKVIRIIDEASAKALLKAELLPPQHKPAHVKVRQQW